MPAATLRQFCDGSVAMLAWLEGHGVPFEGSLCPDKTSYPTNRHYLYFSGSELSAAPAPAATPSAATPPATAPSAAPPATAAAAPALAAAAPGAAAPGGLRTGPPPAPRGHRTRLHPGGLLYARLSAAVHCRRRGPRAHPDRRPPPGHRPRRPCVTGVECLSLRAAPSWARLAHRVLHRWSVRPYLYVPKLGRILHRPVSWLEHRYAHPP